MSGDEKADLVSAVLRKRKFVVLQSFKDGTFTLSKALVPCGKKNCTKCPHGPYWYGGYMKKGKWRTFYIGKTLLSERLLRRGGTFERVQRIAEREELDDAFKEVLKHGKGSVPPGVSAAG